MCYLICSEMLVFLLLISVHLASARFLVSMPVLKVMYGSVGVEDLMLPPESRRADFDNEVHSNHEELPDFPDFLREIEDMQQWSLNLNSSDLDLKDLNDASKDLIDLKKDLETVANNATRRQNSDGLNLPHEVADLWKDPRALREWYYQKLCLTFLIHIRFQVDTAIRQKMAVNAFRGYRIGYLFHRLLNIRSQMARIREEWDAMRVPRLAQNRPNWRSKKHSLQMLLQMYERVLQLDVDNKDTYEMIKMVFYGRKTFVTQYRAPPTKPLFK